MNAQYVLFLLSLPLLGLTAAIETVTFMTFTPASIDGAPYFPYPEEVTSGLPFAEPSYSVGGVGSDGLTTYIEEVVKSQDFHVGGIPTATTTLSGGSVETLVSYYVSTATFPATTLRATIVAGATEYKYFAPVGLSTDPEANLDGVVDCHWDEDRKGECEVKISNQNDSSAVTFTASGNFGPVHTLVVSGASASGQPSQTAASFATRQVLISTSAIVFASAAFFVLL